MEGVEFNEPRTAPKQLVVKNGSILVRWLLKTRWIENEQQAISIYLGVVAFCILLGVFILIQGIRTNTGTDDTPRGQDPGALLSQQ